jgi:hypothetical protein
MDRSRADSIITVVVKDLNDNIIPEFKFIVNENNVGDPQVELPEEMRDPSKFPSLNPPASHSPVVATGDSLNPTVTLPDGKYLISILAPGYKIGGNWVKVAGGDETVVVSLHSDPLPLSKIRVHVFHDNQPVNGEDDFPVEAGLEGFFIQIEDAVGQVTVDYFGNPIGTQYVLDGNGEIVFNSEGNPMIARIGGKILTDAGGNAIIENIPPGKYEVQAIPPDGTDWIQTTTIEGTHAFDVWIEEGNDGYSYEEGFQMPLAWLGFVRPMVFAEADPAMVGTVKGRIRSLINAPPTGLVTMGNPVDRPCIALTDIGANDQQVFMGRGDGDGNFVIINVPPGTYQMAIWDEPLDYIISFRTVEVQQGATLDMGDIGIPRWFGYIKGTVFHDADSNGVGGQTEEGISNVELATRFKDGSIQYTTISDMSGNYNFDEVFELEHFAVAEVGYTRFSATGATAIAEFGTPYQRPAETYNQPAPMLTLAELTAAGATNRIDWGKKPYSSGQNGGITGIVYYATMRNELDPRYAVAEDYEPGVPDVTVNLYAATVDPLSGEVTRENLINIVTTDAWQHPTGCTDWDGNPASCLEVPSLPGQIRPSVFDGGYAFTSWFDPYYEAPGAVEKPLLPGAYIVEVVLPAGYKILDENSVNTGEGDIFVNSLARKSHTRILTRMAPPPYYQDFTQKVISLRDGLNATGDFFIYTDVPVPGRIVGLLVDDLNVETNPNSLYFGEKRGIPNSPVGIRDFTGRLITTVHSDINGIFEVLLPSTYTRNVPTPSGVAPGMYQVIGNDPGDPDKPNTSYNPDYQTLKLVFDVWPGKTTYADVALFPITPFVAVPGGDQFTQPPDCTSPVGTPELFRVDRIFVEPEGNRTITITGSGFGLTPGVIKLDDENVIATSWSDTVIVFDVPVALPGGPKQLLISRGDKEICATGITIHVFDDSYRAAAILTVPSADYPTIQLAIDAAPENALIVVLPGTYYENPILYKNIKLQGMGAHDTNIDGRFFQFYAADWLAKLAGIDFDGPEFVPPDPVAQFSRGQVITVVAKTGLFNADFRPQLDGFTISGGRGTHGGGIYIHAHGQNFVISNNVIKSNGGGFGGGVTIGKPYTGDNFNDNIRIGHNRITNNGGISLAGGIGIFNGADNYVIDHNQICGNYSGEYGGGISHFGLSNSGKMHHNCILFNASFDEGGGILVGGEQPVPPAVLTTGSGNVDIYDNMVKSNVANDDGGGIRLLKPLDYPINIYNNMIVNNISTDLGGGIALDDASNVVIYNNTVAKNITTATAEDSDGLPHVAGLASELHSAAFRAVLPPDAPAFSDPVLFNNIFWDNRAGLFDPTLNSNKGGIAGIGAVGDPHPVNRIDLEVFVSTDLFTPEYCLLSVPYPAGNNNLINLDPAFVAEYDTQVSVVSFNLDPTFKTVKIIVTPEAQGDYHLTIASPAINTGTPAVTRLVNGVIVTYSATADDFDGDARPQPPLPNPNAKYDIGADEFVFP